MSKKIEGELTLTSGKKKIICDVSLAIIDQKTGKVKEIVNGSRR